ncbi:MAG: hypothetical protein R3264_19510, partial [Anaerolineae bacterium]|nr:hypothetical protein [Anaerolineae bacterium]
AANAQADANTACPFAKNLVAESIKQIVTGYRAVNPNLAYIVIIGDDDIIPFFRHPDNTLLGNEENYVPPVLDDTHSQSSLRLGFVLGQDAYGSKVDISAKVSDFPIPDLPVGRLVETATDITGMLDAYLDETVDGVVPTPQTALVTGYDFLEDAALEVQSQLEAGLNNQSDLLLSAQDLPPAQGWTAEQLGDLILNNRYDVAFLAGHFSANSALAADYETSLITTQLVESTVDMTNAIFFSAGCHSGYNIVNSHSVPFFTLPLDWSQAFAQKRATLIAGTGYQYGDTDFLEYSERIYAEFSRQLRVGAPGEPVSIGNAFVASKQIYLANTPKVEGLHEKALLEATIFGLPMLSIVMPGERIAPDSAGAPISPTPFTTNPGSTLNLEFSDVTLNPNLTLQNQTLDIIYEDPPNPGDPTQVTAQYLTGSNGLVTNVAEPALPLEALNVTADNGKVLRGVGFRGGTFTDLPEIVPLTGAPTTEIRGVHAPFLSDVFFPIRPWHINYYDALADGSITTLFVTPAQHQSTAPGSQTSTLRRFDQMNFRLYYSDNIATFDGGSTPALSAAPKIAEVRARVDGGSAQFGVQVVGNPAAGIQEVWVTYTALSGPFAGQWQSLDLTQDSKNSTIWKGTLDLAGTNPDDVRFMVQAVNGV